MSSDATFDPAAIFREVQERQQRRQRYGSYDLVQRLEESLSPGTGFDAKFGLAYMGSSEYEFGKPYKSLTRMRQAGKCEKRAIEVTRQGVTKTVYFVGPKKILNDRIVGFREWFATDQLQTKERSKFDEVFTQTPFTEGFPVDDRTIAWWSLEDDVMWALDESIADRLLEAVLNPPT